MNHKKTGGTWNVMEEGKVYVVLDADLAEDYWDGNRDFKLNFTLELTIK